MKLPADVLKGDYIEGSQSARGLTAGLRQVEPRHGASERCKSRPYSSPSQARHRNRDDRGLEI